MHIFTRFSTHPSDDTLSSSSNTNHLLLTHPFWGWQTPHQQQGSAYLLRREGEHGPGTASSDFHIGIPTPARSRHPLKTGSAWQLCAAGSRAVINLSHVVVLWRALSALPVPPVMLCSRHPLRACSALTRQSEGAALMGLWL